MNHSVINNQFSNLVINHPFIQYFNAHFCFKPFGFKVSRRKIKKSSLASWSFGLQWTILWTLEPLCVSLWRNRKKYSINFSCLNPSLPSVNQTILTSNFMYNHVHCSVTTVSIKDLMHVNRFERIYSIEEKLNNLLEQIGQWLVKRGYKEDHVDSEIERVKSVKRIISFQKHDKKNWW